MAIDSTAVLAGKKILITGATGFTGQELTRQLLAAGAEVRVIVRPSSDRSGLQHLAIQWFVGDVYDAELLRDAMKDVHYVFHLATLYRSGDATEAEHHRVHVASTQRLAELAIQQPEFMRFIHVSTVGVHGHIEYPPADENTPFQPGDEYQRTKAEAETWLTDFAAARSLPYTIIRPAAIYGPGDQRLLKVFRLARRSLAPILGRKPCLYHLIHVEDLARLMLLAAAHPNAAGQVFIAGDPAPIALDAMLRIIGQELGKKPRIIRLPVTPFMGAAWVCEKIFPPLGIRPPIYRRRVKFFLNDRSFNTDKIRDFLNFNYVHQTEEGLRKTARWYQDHDWL
jgi:dihydroflavonol-4-reductase